MIKLFCYQSWHEKNDFLQSFDFSNSTLIIPDLISKNLWHQEIIRKKSFVDGPQVMRATELWETILLRSNPSLRVVSTPWMLHFIQKQIDTLPETDSQSLSIKAATILRALNEFMPILCQDPEMHVMEPWFDDPKNKGCSWRALFYACQWIWRSLREKQILISSWSSAFLTLNPSVELYWTRPLVIDLGPEIRTLEIELFSQIAKFTSVTLLVPEPKWINKFPWIEFPYQQVKESTGTKKDLSQKAWDSPTTSFCRFSSQVAEVKAAVSQIRKWQSDGLRLNQIGIIAPDIEHYWPVLRWHLTGEGVQAHKGVTTSILQRAPVLAWIHRLRDRASAPPSKETQQVSRFHVKNYRGDSHIVFLANWKKEIFERTTKLSLDSSLNQDLSKEINHTKHLEASDFINWVFENSGDFLHSLKETDSLFKTIEDWLGEALLSPSTDLSRWVDYLQSFLSETEITLSPKPENGLWLSSLTNGLSPQVDHLIVLGCSESQLKSSSGFISGSDVLKLQYHTGHLLAHPDRDFKEYQLQLLSEQGCELYFYFGESDFSGNELVPSLFWLNGRERAQQKFNMINTWTPSYWEAALQKNSCATESVPMPIRISPGPDLTLSPATLQKWHQCPFKYFSEKGLKLADPIVIDLEMDPRTSGTMKHRLLELLTPKDFDPSSLRANLNQLVHSVLDEHSSDQFSIETRRLFEGELLNLGMQFIHHEAEYRKRFPNFITIAREAWFKIPIEREWGTLLFRGKIDRIDASRDGKKAIVIDYKSDITGYRNASSWLKNLEFQLPAYTYAVENSGIKDLEPEFVDVEEVIAAHYYSLKDFSRKGFTLENEGQDRVETPTSKSSMTRDEKASLLREFEAILTTTTDAILNGDFAPHPHPQTDCKTCSWRFLCRSNKQNL